MPLPYNPQLNISALSRSFDDMSESYKIFWFNGFMEEIKSGKSKTTFADIICHMVVSALFMVSEYHLNLGPSDTLEKLVLRAQEISGLKTSSKPEEIMGFLTQTDDKEICRALHVLTLNVPYRLHAPFLADFKGNSWSSKARIIARVNSDPSTIYYFGAGTGLNTEVVVRPQWFNYLYENQAIITGWIEYNLILYLQRKNPNVPGIANKLVPPEKRQLDAAKKFWRAVSEIKRIPNIYDNGTVLVSTDISIDHFVPWSFVAHDEMWNLVPTTKGINSSKGNQLPSWDVYFPLLQDVEYKAFRCACENSVVKVYFEKCKKELINSDDVLVRLYKENITRSEFCARLEELVLPAYTAAKNMGFGMWAR